MKLRHKYQRDAWDGYSHPDDEMQYNHEACAILMQRATGKQTVPIVRDDNTGQMVLRWNRVNKIPTDMLQRATHYDRRLKELLLEEPRHKVFKEELAYVMDHCIPSEEHNDAGYQMWIDWLVEDGFLEVEYKISDQALSKVRACESKYCENPKH